MFEADRPAPTNHPTSITYHFDYRRVKATDFVDQLFPCRVQFVLVARLS